MTKEEYKTICLELGYSEKESDRLIKKRMADAEMIAEYSDKDFSEILSFCLSTTLPAPKVYF